jgi:hypothetical protein
VSEGIIAWLLFTDLTWLKPFPDSDQVYSDLNITLVKNLWNDTATPESKLRTQKSKKENPLANSQQKERYTEEENTHKAKSPYSNWAHIFKF